MSMGNMCATLYASLRKKIKHNTLKTQPDLPCLDKIAHKTNHQTLGKILQNILVQVQVDWYRARHTTPCSCI